MAPDVVVALDDEAGDRRVQGGVALHLADTAERGFRLRQIGLGKVALRHGRTMRRFGGVETLPRQRAALEQRLRAFMLENGVGEPGVGALERRLGDANRGDAGVHLRVHFAAIDRGQRPGLR